MTLNKTSILISAAVAVVTLTGASIYFGFGREEYNNHMKITHINPEGLYKSPVFSQAVLVEGGKTLYIGGQNGILPNGKMAGETLGVQTEQALKNILEILKSVGASQENVVKLTMFIAKGQDIREGYAASQKVWGNFPTTISGVFVEGLTVPGSLIEIEAVAVIE